MSEVCAKAGKQHLGVDVTVVPAGGSQLPYLAQVLHSRGIFFVIVVDGDEAGRNIKKRTLELCPIDESRIVTLNEIRPEEHSPNINDLFSSKLMGKKLVRERGLFQVISSKQADTNFFDDETLNRFQKVFTAVSAVIPQRSAYSAD